MKVATSTAGESMLEGSYVIVTSPSATLNVPRGGPPLTDFNRASSASRARGRSGCARSLQGQLAILACFFTDSKTCAARASPCCSVGGKNARESVTIGERIRREIPPKCVRSQVQVSRCHASSSGSRKYRRPNNPSKAKPPLPPAPCRSPAQACRDRRRRRSDICY